jgi:YcxB-like protein
VHEIEFQLEPADIEAWFLSGLDRIRGYRLTYWACGLVVSGVLAVAADKWRGSVTVSAAMAVAGFAIGWALARGALRSHLRVFARELATGPGATSQFGPHRLCVDAAGVSQTGPAAQHKHAWRAVLGLTETADHMFLLVGGGSAYVIPKRAFESAAAIDAFRVAVSEERSKAE